MLKSLTAGIMVSLLTAANAAFSENLLKNGDLERPDYGEFTPSGISALYKYGIFTEDLTWNKCAKIEILGYHENKEGVKSVGVGIVIGGAKGSEGQDGRNAIDVMPDTTYKFSLSLKGTVDKANISVFTWDGSCEDYKERKRVKTSLGAVKAQPDWTLYQGEFKTGNPVKKAALFVQVWCDQGQGGLTEKPGAYLMIDNVSIAAKEEESPLQSKNAQAVKVEAKGVCCAPFVGQKPILDGRIDDDAWKNAGVVDGFFKLLGDSKADVQTECRVLADADSVWLGIRCAEPEIAKIKAKFSKDGEAVWSDDCIEIFMASKVEDILLYQFIINSIGARMMTWGNQPKQPDSECYSKWQAKTAKGENEWTMEVRIPYELLGLKGKPASGFSMGFNVARERYAGKTELSTWSPVNGSFHRKEKFGVLVLGSLKDEAMDRIKSVGPELSVVPADIPQEAARKRKEIEAKLADWEKKLASETVIDIDAWRTVYLDTEIARKEILRLKYANLKFAVTKVAPIDDFTAPYNPSSINPEMEKTGIELKAGINEFESLPIAVSNLTDATESYRVIIFGYEDNGIEVADLKGESEGMIFPASAIEMKEAVRVKDGDGEMHGQRFDPLPAMNRAYTITVPPRESGLVWVTFNCAGAKPGVYKGTLRVIPLNQSAKFVLANGWQYEGKMKDVPLKLEIWPIELSPEPIVSSWLMRSAGNEKFFVDMIRHGCRDFQISPWLFKTTFNKDGSIKETDHKMVDKAVRDHLDWAKKHEVKIKFPVWYSCHDIFYKEFAKKEFKIGSPEWEKAWTSWLGSIQDVFKRHNIPETDYSLEIFDEPKDFNEAMLCVRAAKKACPSMRMTITLGCPHWPVDEIREMGGVADELYVHDSYWGGAKAYSELFKELKGKGKTVSYYICPYQTLVVYPPYQCYRLYAWKGHQRGLDGIGICKYMSGPGGYYGRGSWKENSADCVVYNSFNEPITSIRFECMRDGMDDVKYLDLLARLARQTEGRVDSKLTKECGDFLNKIQEDVVINFPHKSGMAEEGRLKAAQLIIELQKGKQ